MKVNVKVLTKKLNAGIFNVILLKNHEEIGTFETNDMQLIDDIQEMNNNGLESELMMHDNFNEVVKTCISNIDINF